LTKRFSRQTAQGHFLVGLTSRRLMHFVTRFSFQERPAIQRTWRLRHLSNADSARARTRLSIAWYSSIDQSIRISWGKISSNSGMQSSDEIDDGHAIRCICERYRYSIWFKCSTSVSGPLLISSFAESFLSLDEAGHFQHQLAFHHHILADEAVENIWSEPVITRQNPFEQAPTGTTSASVMVIF
jgi:hypothetical protein